MQELLYKQHGMEDKVLDLKDQPNNGDPNAGFNVRDVLKKAAADKRK